MDKECLSGQTGQFTLGNFMTIISKVQALTSGLMEEYTWGIGLIIRCMAGDYSSGKMGDDMKDNMRMIRRKDKELMNGMFSSILF